MAENKDGQEKSEPASAKRVEEAHLRGQVAKSTDVTTAVIVLFGVVIFFTFGNPMISSLKGFMAEMFGSITTIEITSQNVVHHYESLLLFLASIMLPILLLIFVMTLTSEISQVGFKIATKKFTEGGQWKQLANPAAGLKKIFFSSRSLFELGKSLAKIFVSWFCSLYCAGRQCGTDTFPYRDALL